MVSVSNHDTPPPKRAVWRRTPFERRIADCRRFLIRNRLLVRSAVIAFVLGLIAGSLALGLPGAIAGAFEFAKTAIGGKAGLKVELVTIAGLEHLDEAAVADALALGKDTPLLDVDVAEVRKRIVALGWVKDATVERIPPNRLHVSITEYEPRILWDDHGRFFVADEFGHVIARADPVTYSALLRVSGKGAPAAAPELKEWLNAFPEVATLVKNAERVGDRRWNLHLSNQLVVELPDRGLDEALAVLMRMITKDDLLVRDVDRVDLRDPKEPRFTLGDDAARALHVPGGGKS